MPTSFTSLLEPLPEHKTPWLETSDERLLNIDSMAARERFDLAAPAVENLLAEDIVDIRPLPYLLYSTFTSGDASKLVDVLRVVENLLGPSFSQVGPETRRQEYFNKRLRWLFDKIAGSLAFEEKSNSQRWQQWSTPPTPETFPTLLERGAKVGVLLEPAVYKDAHGALLQVLALVRGLKEAPAETVPRSRTAPPPSHRTGTTEAEAKPIIPAANSQGHWLTPVELMASPAFLDLCNRLQAFEKLVQKEQLDKAAVVASDIQERISTFDPRAYFPELFSSFVALHSRHVVAFTRHEETMPEHAWRALRQYYLVDLRTFTEG
ncbi:MAG TPA: type VI secretion system protein IglI family protein [Polyangiaceae bacterium]|jgi:hypothetical protein|nr:type VI secretion system protein IglI family protein [Polyangiaceae bacterium]